MSIPIVLGVVDPNQRTICPLDIEAINPRCYICYHGYYYGHYHVDCNGGIDRSMKPTFFSHGDSTRNIEG
jgi:hypothetical protein